MNRSIGAMTRTFTDASISVYAIRRGGQIEIRTSEQPIEAKHSRWTHMATERMAEYDHKTHKVLYKDVPKKYVMEQVFFVGGNPMGHVHARTFERLMGMRVPPESCVRLSDAQVKMVFSESWKRRLRT